MCSRSNKRKHDVLTSNKGGRLGPLPSGSLLDCAGLGQKHVATTSKVGRLSSGVTSAKNDVFASNKVEIGPKRFNNGPKQAEKKA